MITLFSLFLAKATYTCLLLICGTAVHYPIFNYVLLYGRVQLKIKHLRYVGVTALSNVHTCIILLALSSPSLIQTCLCLFQSSSSLSGAVTELDAESLYEDVCKKPSETLKDYPQRLERHLQHTSPEYPYKGI